MNLKSYIKEPKYIIEDPTYFKCLTFDCSSVFLRIILASTNGLGSTNEYKYKSKIGLESLHMEYGNYG